MMIFETPLLGTVETQYDRAKLKAAQQASKVAALRSDDPSRPVEIRLLAVMRENAEFAHFAMDLGLVIGDLAEFSMPHDARVEA